MKKAGRIGKVYRLLLKAFGPQGWWPVAELPAPTAGNAALIRPVAELPAPTAGNAALIRPVAELPAEQRASGSAGAGRHVARPPTAGNAAPIWPVTPRDVRRPGYSPGFYGPHTEAGMAEICAGAILTQNTAWTNVEKALAGLSGAGLLPGAGDKIAACPLPRLARLIRPSGYYRQKARRLRDFFARAAKEHPAGLARWFRSSRAAALRAELLSYKGVGPETADSIVLYAAGLPSFVIDAYTRRIGSRLGLGRGGDYERWKSLFEAGLPRRPEIYNEYHALLVRLGKDFCRKNSPLCGGCPLRGECHYAGRRKDHGKDRSSARQRRIQKGPRRH